MTENFYPIERLKKIQIHTCTIDNTIIPFSYQNIVWNERSASKLQTNIQPYIWFHVLKRNVEYITLSTH